MHDSSDDAAVSSSDDCGDSAAALRDGERLDDDADVLVARIGTRIAKHVYLMPELEVLWSGESGRQAAKGEFIVDMVIHLRGLPEDEHGVPGITKLQNVLAFDDAQFEKFILSFRDRILARRAAAQPQAKQAIGAGTLRRCKHFGKKEGCKWGTECRFLHEAKCDRGSA